MRFLPVVLLFLFLVPCAYAQVDTATVIRQVKHQGANLVAQADALDDQKRYLEAGRLLASMDINDTLYLSYITRAVQLLSDTTAGEADIAAVLETLHKYYPQEARIRQLCRAYYHCAGQRTDSVLAATNDVLTRTPTRAALSNIRSGYLVDKKQYAQMYEDAKVYLPFQPFNGTDVKRLALAAYHERRYGQFYAWCLFGLANMTSEGEAATFLALIEQVMLEGVEPAKGPATLPKIEALDDLDDILQSGAAAKNTYKYRGPMSDLRMMKQIHLFFSGLKQRSFSGNSALETVVLPYITLLQDQELWPVIAGGAVYLSTRGKYGKEADLKRWLGMRMDMMFKVPALHTVSFRGKKYTVESRYTSDNGEASTLVEGDFDPKNWSQIHVVKLYRAGTLEAEFDMKSPGAVEGTYKVYHPDESLEAIKTFQGGKLNGPYTAYTPQGVMTYKADYKNDEEDGDVWYYYPSGALKKRIQKRMGVATDYESHYYEDGTLKDTVAVLNGKAQGVQKRYSGTGHLTGSFSYTNGDLNGPFTTYYANGAKREEGAYVNGKSHGKYTAYYANGRLRGTTVYENDRVVDTLFQYDVFGRLEEKDFARRDYDNRTEHLFDKGKHYASYTYKAGKLHAVEYYDAAGKVTSSQEGLSKGRKTIKIYYPNGKLLTEYAVEDGRKHGRRVEYYPTGGKMNEANYINDEREGSYIGYFSNGKVASELTYRSGKEHGLQLYYHANGKLRSVYYSDKGTEEGYSLRYDTKGRVSHRTPYVGGEEAGWSQQVDSAQGLRIESRTRNGAQDVLRYYLYGKYYTDINELGRNGVVEVRDSLKRLYRTITYKDGIRFGKEGFFHPATGKPYSEAFSNGNDLQGAYRIYDETGKLFRESTYSDRGQLTGVTSYYVAGELDSRETYMPDKDSSHTVILGPYGKVSSTYGEISDDTEGWRTYYDPMTGAVAGFLYFEDDMVMGYAEPDAAGKPKALIRLAEERQTVTTHYANGKKGLEFDVMNGLRNGVFKRYYETGAVFMDMTFLNGHTDGRLQEFFQDGKPCTDEHYICGERYGVSRYYYPSGKLRAELNYYDGDKEGWQRYYSETGALVGEFWDKANLAIRKK